MAGTAEEPDMLYDISPPLDARLAVWPGDCPLRREVVLDGSGANGVTSSNLHCTAHLGAHADAFSHVERDAATIDRMELDRYIGPCQVIRVPARRRAAILPPDLPEPVRAPRVLLATGTYPDPTSFNEDFAALSPELVDVLAALGVILIGIDSPSIDLFGAAELPVHHRLVSHRIAGLEGLRLADVPPGIYELIAPPLRLINADASPVRAILRTL